MPQFLSFFPPTSECFPGGGGTVICQRGGRGNSLLGPRKGEIFWENQTCLPYPSSFFLLFSHFLLSLCCVPRLPPFSALQTPPPRLCRRRRTVACTGDRRKGRGTFSSRSLPGGGIGMINSLRVQSWWGREREEGEAEAAKASIECSQRKRRRRGKGEATHFADYETTGKTAVQVSRRHTFWRGKEGSHRKRGAVVVAAAAQNFPSSISSSSPAATISVKRFYRRISRGRRGGKDGGKGRKNCPIWREKEMDPPKKGVRKDVICFHCRSRSHSHMDDGTERRKGALILAPRSPSISFGGGRKRTEKKNRSFSPSSPSALLHLFHPLSSLPPSPHLPLFLMGEMREWGNISTRKGDTFASILENSSDMRRLTKLDAS